MIPMRDTRHPEDEDEEAPQPEPDEELAEEEAGDGEEPTEAPGDDEEVGDEEDEEPPPPPPAPASPNAKVVKVLPSGHVPLPVVAVGDPRVPLDATTLAEAAICAAVFRVMAERAEAILAAILAADDELPPFVMDDADRDLLAAMFAKDTALAARIRLAAGTTPRDAVA
jgi:hypothetical protein